MKKVLVWKEVRKEPIAFENIVSVKEENDIELWFRFGLKKLTMIHAEGYEIHIECRNYEVVEKTRVVTTIQIAETLDLVPTPEQLKHTQDAVCNSLKDLLKIDEVEVVNVSISPEEQK